MIRRKKPEIRRCEGCNGIGAIISFNDKKERYELQKCDVCDVYKDDVEAWQDLSPEIVNKSNKQIN